MLQWANNTGKLQIAKWCLDTASIDVLQWVYDNGLWDDRKARSAAVKAVLTGNIFSLCTGGLVGLHQSKAYVQIVN